MCKDASFAMTDETYCPGFQMVGMGALLDRDERLMQKVIRTLLFDDEPASQPWLENERCGSLVGIRWNLPQSNKQCKADQKET